MDEKKDSLSLFFFSWSQLVACGILVSQLGMEPKTPALGACSLNHWTSVEVPRLVIMSPVCFEFWKQKQLACGSSNGLEGPLRGQQAGSPTRKHAFLETSFRECPNPMDSWVRAAHWRGSQVLGLGKPILQRLSSVAGGGWVGIFSPGFCLLIRCLCIKYLLSTKNGSRK